MLKITFSAEDYLALFTGIGSNDVQLPQRVISRDDFPDCPTDAVGQPVPILYGDLRESGSAALDRPRWVENYTYGMRWAEPWQITDGGRQTSISGSQWLAGCADRGFASPTITSVADGAGGSIDTGIVPWYNRFYVQAVTINASGEYSTMFPKWPAAVIWGATGYNVVTVTSGVHYDDYASDDRTFTVTFTWPAGATTGWVTRVYLGWNYYGIRWTQYIDVAHPATSCAFDKFGDGLPLSNPGHEIATGATFNSYAGGPPFWTVRAYDGSGEGPDSVVAKSHSEYAGKPIYLEWAAVTGATGYRVYQWRETTSVGAEPGGWGLPVDPIRYWDVGNNLTCTTANSDGGGGTDVVLTTTPVRGIPVRHVGQLTDENGAAWEAFLVAGHACKTVPTAYLAGEAISSSEIGNTVALPDGTNWTTLFGTPTYRDINGNRYTLVYVRGTLADQILQDGLALTVDVTGIETAGDGSGTLITDSFEQYEHLLRNWVLRSYASGAWATVGPTWGDTPYDVDVIDHASFLAAKVVADARISGGYTGAFGIGLDDFGTVRQWVARLNQSADCYCGFSRKSQFIVTMLDASYTNVLAAPSFTAELGILQGSFRIEDDALAIQNQILTSYDYNWSDGSWRFGLTREDTAAQAAIGETRPYALELYATRNAAQAVDIAARRLERRRFPYRVVRFESDMGGLTLDLGDLVRISHPDGLGASGWTDRAGWVIRHEFDPSRFVVALDVLDIDFLVNLRLVMPAGALTVTGATPSVVVA